MPVVIVAAAIAAAAALIGAAIASGDQAKAQAIREDIAKKIGATKLPVLDRLVAQKLPPESLAAWMKITKAGQTQNDVLGKYNEVINEKGETADDRAAYLRMQQQAGGIANATQGAVQRGMADRGLAGSGMSFALQQQGAQSAVNRANEMGIQAAADARGRYMDALGQAGNLSTSMRGQEQNALHAQDSINEFNARQQSDADRHNAGISQQNFDNEMGRNAVEANAKNGVAAGYERSADDTRQTAGGIGSAVMTAGATYDQYGKSKQELVDPNDPSKGYKQSAGGR